MLTSCFVGKRILVSVLRENHRNVRRGMATNLPVTAKNFLSDQEDEAPVSSVTEKMKKMSKENASLVFVSPGEGVLDPVLPENPAELAYLDPADLYNVAARYQMDGTPRQVVIRQEPASARQAPFNAEYFWYIKFQDDGTSAERWKNSLMGWESSADPYDSAHDLKFNNAAEAVYFAKKRGWKYSVAEPIIRIMGENNTQYQDNFLPQAVAALVKAEGVSCRQWERSASGTSHYARPLKYHGDGTVRQHGPHRDAPIAKFVEGYYKKR